MRASARCLTRLDDRQYPDPPKGHAQCSRVGRQAQGEWTRRRRNENLNLGSVANVLERNRIVAGTGERDHSFLPASADPERLVRVGGEHADDVELHREALRQRAGSVMLARGPSVQLPVLASGLPKPVNGQELITLHEINRPVEPRQAGRLAPTRTIYRR